MVTEDKIAGMKKEQYREIFGVRYEVFQKMKRVLETECPPQKRGRPWKISVTDKLVVALLYLREYPTMRYLAWEYGISLGAVCESIRWVKNTLLKICRLRNFRHDLTAETQGRTLIADVTECAIERPKKNQGVYYSGKKKRHTMKVQVLADEKTQNILSVYIADGHIHDFQVYKNSGTVLAESAKLLADSGYQGIRKLHENSETPVKASKLHSLTEEEKQYNRDLGSRRIVIEHINARLKSFGILSGRFRNDLSTFADTAVLLCTVVNMNLSQKTRLMFAS